MKGFSLKKSSDPSDQPKKSFGGFQIKKPANGQKTLGVPKKLAKPVLTDDSRGNDDEVKEVEISSFDENTFGSKPGLLVIRPKSKKDWRAEALERRDQEVTVSEDTLKYGLNTFEAVSTKSDSKNEDTIPVAFSKSVEEQARESLRNGVKTTSQRVIVMDDDQHRLDNELKEMPESSSLEDYEKVPVEEFGAALLRGMGWKDNTQRPSKSTTTVTKRPPLLGIGAKALPGMEVSRNEVYSPVIIRNKETGEIVNEKEQSRERERSPAGRNQSYRDRK
ncbi:unnamed protein product [Kuraishia capsulata CBS 1993]|uniref:Pre-mRNA-splicing factor n=1 Tax=Kuraishia capsulata CBS 1993 TaxID=1382522 RepID=W6MR50_9ASCO|nr:uncharacterized protein KUCA_T00005197001 [Kuraishia capsulata CBS 1993]CDK29209.1 unnamed protein product [Kuraishia capsulata CBS 1993]